MSEILVNKLTGTSTAGSILVTGEGNSTTTNLQQGLAKAWFNFNQDGPAVDNSLNVSSITDVGTGIFDPQWANSFSNADYVCSGMGPDTFFVCQDDGHEETILTTTSDCQMKMTQYAGSLVDARQTMVAIHGDLA
jgi:hypothetical protein